MSNANTTPPPIVLIGGRRLTALELLTLKIPSVMVCDSMVGSLFQHHKIDAIGVFDLFYSTVELTKI